MWEWRGTPGGGRSRAKRQGDEAHSGLGFAVKCKMVDSPPIRIIGSSKDHSPGKGLVQALGKNR